MRVLIVGGGGREHALAWRLDQEDPTIELLAAPGNPGIAELAECHAIDPANIDALAELARSRSVDLTIVGPEAPLAVGVVDYFRELGLPIFGPTRAAAEIETSKAFAKQVMLEDGIPTARAEMHTDPAKAKAALHRFSMPVVIKASGLAAGKGVIICQTADEAKHTIDDMLSGNLFGDAGAEVLVEEFMQGEELSIFAITDGRSFVMLPALQDHKRLLDGDAGPNTGGMGAYLPVSIASPSVATETAEQIIASTLRALNSRNRTFTGLLYAGLMLTRDGLKVVEFNCRFGDPETQALMPALGDLRLLDLFHRVATGASIDSAIVDTRGAAVACVTTVLAAANYPGKPRSGDVITLPPGEADVFVFHAGTARDSENRLVTAGGRVLAVSAVAPTIQEAHHRSLDFAKRVQFAGKQFRSDIGWREIARRQS